MRLLQVNNVSQMVGGTANCSKDIVRALPGVDHSLFFFSGVSQDAKEAFAGCDLSHGDKIPASEIELADVIIFHNTSAARMPLRFDGNALRVYYQHSATKSAKEHQSKCDLYFCVSKWLAKQCGQDESCVLYQPVSIPKAPEDQFAITGEVRIGRICTPRPQKWQDGDLFPLYEKLGHKFPEVTWEFVGCPDSIRPRLTCCLPKTKFYEASPSARSLLWEWGAMLYSGSLPESYGRTVCEAQRAGCVPIVRNVGAFPEQIDDMKTGFLCDSDEEFLLAVNEVVNSKSLNEGQVLMQASAARSGLREWRTKFLEALKGVGK